jgi:hypothetical protein
MTDLFAIIVAALFGAIVGSFLNVCIHRLPLGTSIAWPGSACPHCGRSLAWFENIPIVSYLALRARCRTCRAPISARYPTIEALTAAMFALAWWHYGPGALLASRLVLGCALIALFEIDRDISFYLTRSRCRASSGFIFSCSPNPDGSRRCGDPRGRRCVLGVGYTCHFAARRRPRHGRLQDARDDWRVPRWRLTLVTLMMASLIGSVVGVLLIVTGGAG